MEMEQIVNYLKIQKEATKLHGEMDIDLLCNEMNMKLEELVYFLVGICLMESKHKALWKDKFLQEERKSTWLNETIHNLENNGNRIQKTLVKSGMPIAKKKSRLSELKLRLMLKNTDEELMRSFDISRTTLWRWKKELKELEQAGKI